MIKLKPLIKEDCGCGCGGCETKLNESLQLPNGNKIQMGRIFTGQGKAFAKVKEESFEEAKKFKPEKRRKVKNGEVEIMKGRGSKQKWFYLKDKNDVHKLIRLGRNYGFPTGITNNNSRIDKSFIKRLSINERLIDIDKQMKDGTFDEKNPQVHIMGYGVMSLKNLGEQLSKKFTDLAKRAKKGEIENVDSVLNKSGVLQGFVKAYMDAKKELKSSSMKRKITMYKRSR